MTSAKRRVAITGYGVVTPLGHTPDELFTALLEGRSSSVAMTEWAQFKMRGLVASKVQNFDDKKLPRAVRKSMSRVSLFAQDATASAIAHAELSDAIVKSPRTGVSYGSTMGGVTTIEDTFEKFSVQRNFDGILTHTFLQIMSHTAAANIAHAFGISGRLISSCTACASSNQSIGFGFESVRNGIADQMICGGAEELSKFVAGVFDVMRAASSRYNETPEMTPRPFSKTRDGIVVGEGAGTLILEDMELARRRGAVIAGEVIGFYTHTDVSHMTNPSVEGMKSVMQGALESAGISPSQIDYINAHGTGTDVGDIAESTAIFELFGKDTPVSTLKGHFGHLMGACGVVELIASLKMMEHGVLIPTLHLEDVDPACAPIDFVRLEPRRKKVKYVLKNSFAFGGINSCLVIKKEEP